MKKLLHTESSLAILKVPYIEKVKIFIEEADNAFNSAIWIDDKIHHIFFRMGYHGIRRYEDGPAEVATFLDIANVNIRRPGNGHYTKLIEQLVELKPFQGIYVENIFQERFLKWHERNDFIIDTTYPPPSAYKLW